MIFIKNVIQNDDATIKVVITSLFRNIYIYIAFARLTETLTDMHTNYISGIIQAVQEKKNCPISLCITHTMTMYCLIKESEILHTNTVSLFSLSLSKWNLSISKNHVVCYFIDRKEAVDRFVVFLWMLSESNIDSAWNSKVNLGAE